jgi:hypothetical protein
MKKINIKELIPTQFTVGFEQVKEKEQKMSKMNKNELESYLQKKFVPVIKGPQNYFYIIDHHHLTMAAQNLKLKHLYYKIINDFSMLNENEFWNEMKNNKYIWLYDDDGNNLDLNTYVHLKPKHIENLQNDAFRSLAGIIRKKGAYNKVNVPFSEFVWANYLRSEISDLKNDAIIIENKIIDLAIDLSKDKKAKNLPGYIKK